MSCADLPTAHNLRVAYDTELANRVRELVMFEPDISEKAMFGGLAFLVGRRMAVAVSGGGGLLLRVDRDQTEAMLARPHAEPFVMQGREMTGWIRIGADGLQSTEQLSDWVEIGLDVARGLPAEDV